MCVRLVELSFSHQPDFGATNEKPFSIFGAHVVGAEFSSVICMHLQALKISEKEKLVSLKADPSDRETFLLTQMSALWKFRSEWVSSSADSW